MPACRRCYASDACRKFFGISGSTDWNNVLRAIGAGAPFTSVDSGVKGFVKGAEAAACKRRGHLLALSWQVVWRALEEHSEPEPYLELEGLVRGAGLTCR